MSSIVVKGFGGPSILNGFDCARIKDELFVSVHWTTISLLMLTEDDVEKDIPSE